MLSRIQIDLDNDNQPIIKIDYKSSEDVRDKMVKRFMETFGGDSWFATFHFLPTTIDLGNNSAAVIRPLPVKDFGIHLPDMRMVWEKFYQSQNQEVSNEQLSPLSNNLDNADLLSFERVNQMCIESLSPDLFGKWEEVKDRLLLNRAALRNA